jgi:hypothetical protein
MKRTCIIDAANSVSQQLVIPYGERPHSSGLQVFDLSDASAIVEAFNQAAAAPEWKGLPFYIGHPDVPAFREKYPDTRAYGWITAVNAKPDGLTLAVDWTDAGNALLADHAYGWFSQRWYCLPQSRGGRRVLRPRMLKSAGLTNEPNWNVMPVTVANEDPQPDKENAMNLYERLRDLIAKEGVESEDDVYNYVSETIAALQSSRESAETQKEAEDAANEHNQTLRQQIETLTEQKDAAQASLDAANESLAQERAARAELLIDAAISDGRITPARKEHYVGRFGQDFEIAANELAGEAGGMKTKSNLDDAAARGNSQRNARSQIVDAVNEALPEHDNNWHRAYMAVKRKRPELFATTEG